MVKNISQETEADALKVAKSIQKPGQTKEQTKLIAQGVEKGISEYKKQQKIKARERDKQRKQQLKSKDKLAINNENIIDSQKNLQASHSATLPWALLLLSWVIFVVYFFMFT